MTTTKAPVRPAAPMADGHTATGAAEMASSRSTAALIVGSIVAMPRISRRHRLVSLAAVAYLVVPLSVQAGPVVLQNVFYRIQTFGYEPASGGYAFSQESDLVKTTPQPNKAPLPLTRFIRADSDPQTTVGGSYYGTAMPIQGNETLAQVSGTIQLNAYEKLGFFPQRAFLGIGVQADTYYQVMVINTHFVPSDVKGVPIIGTTAGTTSCSGSFAANKTAFAQVIVEDIVYAAAQCPPGKIDTSFSTKVTGTFPIGVPVNVQVSAYGAVNLQVGDQATDNGSFYASADPSFEIDPSFPYANDFELVYSPGLATPADATDIPDPGSLLLLAIGAPLAMASRRRANRRREVPATRIRRQRQVPGPGFVSRWTVS
jgi:hypothetical protein